MAICIWIFLTSENISCFIQRIVFFKFKLVCTNSSVNELSNGIIIHIGNLVRTHKSVLKKMLVVQQPLLVHRAIKRYIFVSNRMINFNTIHYQYLKLKNTFQNRQNEYSTFDSLDPLAWVHLVLRLVDQQVDQCIFSKNYSYITFRR